MHDNTNVKICLIANAVYTIERDVLIFFSVKSVFHKMFAWFVQIWSIILCKGRLIANALCMNRRDMINNSL
jgi:hypothetical protein